MSNVTIAFLGAADTVTGSRFLITGPRSKILIDCGLFQGQKEVRAKNWEPFPVDVKTIDAIILSHAHLDHSGYLPALTKQGYSNPIFATKYTKVVGSIILRDSAKIQTDDANFAKKKGYSKNNPPLALYEATDAEKAIGLFSSTPFHQRTKVAEDAFVTFYPAGHILGSSFLVVEMAEKFFLFTADLGRNNHPLLANPDTPPNIAYNAIISESTYGNRVHDADPEDFAKEINAAVARGGSILIPAFAVDRTEVILMALKELILEKKIPSLPIYVDSPMAIAALDVYRDAITTESPEIRSGVPARWQNQDPFDTGKLIQSITTEESKAINDIKECSIVISASGMATGGRVVHHLANMLPNPSNTVILVGFQAAGSRGRALEEGQTKVKIHGEFVPVNAHIARVESFSVHADGEELIDWIKSIKTPGQVFIVHGEPDSQRGLKDRFADLLGWQATIPKSGQVFEIK
jgi:metallo-beta-lactamase family protein